MGLWKTIGKGLAVAAAPFTGGTSLSAIPFIDAIGSGAGKAAQSMASNRGARASTQVDLQDQLEQQLLAREANTRAAQSDAYRKAVMGDLASSWRPAARPTGTPTISFGGPSERGMTAGSELFEQAMSRMRQPDIAQQRGLPPLKDLSRDPEFQKTQKSGFLEKLLGVGSAVAPIISAGLKGRGQATTSLPTPIQGIPDQRILPGFQQTRT